MARQAGPIFITGTIGDVIFYKLGDHYYMRQKGEPTPATKKRMRQPEHYRLLCLRKQEFKQASQMVREWYYTLPKAVRKHGLFGTLTGKAVRLLRKGKTAEEIKTILLREFGKKEPAAEQTMVTAAVAMEKTAQAITQPTYTPPKQKQKGKKVNTSRLSSWQVSELGQLQKEVAKSKAMVNKEEGSNRLYAGFYSTWTCSGW